MRGGARAAGRRARLLPAVGHVRRLGHRLEVEEAQGGHVGRHAAQLRRQVTRGGAVGQQRLVGVHVRQPLQPVGRRCRQRPLRARALLGHQREVALLAGGEGRRRGRRRVAAGGRVLRGDVGRRGGGGGAQRPHGQVLDARQAGQHLGVVAVEG